MTQSKLTSNQENALPASAINLPLLNISNKSLDNSLEYHIKFPDTSGTNQMYGGRSTTTTTPSDNCSPIPVAVLLGWAGCQDRYLKKYSKIYENQGFITIRYTAPLNTLFWRRSEMVQIGEKILKLMYDMNFEDHPIIFHIFSNGGAYLYQHISLAMKTHGMHLQTRGMIIDSAPGERRFLGLFRAVSAIYSRDHKKFRCLTALLITITLNLSWIMEETYVAMKNLFINTTPLHTNPFKSLQNEPNEFPQLFLYSKADKVIPYADIEKFIQIRQETGVNVKTGCFDDAEHVKLFLKYPVRYVQYIYDFVYNYCNINVMTANESNRSCANNSMTQINSNCQYTQSTTLS